jgi:hypothetical protein
LDRIGATVLLALAAVATAWSSYQEARWNGERAKMSSAANKARIDAARASDLASAQQEVDVATFSQWIDAYARKEARLAAFYFKRFRVEFKPAVNAWLATKPLESDGAPLTPSQCRSIDWQRPPKPSDPTGGGGARRAGATGYPALDELRARGRALRRRAVLRGYEHEAHGVGGRKALLLVGWIVFTGAVAWIATSPASVSI